LKILSLPNNLKNKAKTLIPKAKIKAVTRKTTNISINSHI